ncbi:hypothetical protein AU195_23620 [Mycobacterium sp. IS-1496]|nr:hypothetical protein AU195_23620 [Mycobacterium sp. IS-1496]
MHHVVADWTDGGNTNVDELGLACGPHNRNVDTNDNGWTTRINDQHDVEWIPPPHLDTGQARLNHHHRPERLLTPPDDTDVPGEPVRAADPADANDIDDTAPDPETADDADRTGHAETTTPAADEIHEPVRAAEAITLPADDQYPKQATTSVTEVHDIGHVDPSSPTQPADNTGEPGGPAPPQDRAA